MTSHLELLRQSIPVFSMLQDETRQQILILLCKNHEMTVTEITKNINLSRPAVSHHLSLLLTAKLVSVSKRGTERYYSIHLTDALSLLRDLTAALEQETSSLESLPVSSIKNFDSAESAQQ